MTLHQLHRRQLLPVSIAQAWAFLCDPANLAAITPPSMGFKTLSGAERGMYPGQIIDYEITPLLGIKMSWVTEITHVADGYFVDEQRFGPYAFWHHKHFLKEIDGGVEMEDLLHYAMPFGPIGELIHSLMVRRKLEEIFAFREQKLIELFGAWKK